METRILPDECEHCLLTLFTIYYYYRPPTKLLKGNVFTGVSHFVHGDGYVSSDGHQVPLAGHVYVQKGDMSRGDGYVHGVGVCVGEWDMSRGVRGMSRGGYVWRWRHVQGGWGWVCPGGGYV